MVIKTIQKNASRSGPLDAWDTFCRWCAIGECWTPGWSPGCSRVVRSAKGGGKNKGRVVGQMMQILGGGYRPQALFPMSRGLHQGQKKILAKRVADSGKTVGLTKAEPGTTPAKPALLKCASIENWLDAECDNWRGMVTEREQTWDDVQKPADELHAAKAFGEEEAVKEMVDTSVFQSDADLRASLRESADRLIALTYGLPESLEQQIRSDVEEIGSTVAKLLQPCVMNIALELMKQNCCTRWHQDNYVARAICTYNSHGTEYIHTDYVDMWELNNCGNNDHIIKDVTKVRSITVGDVLLIKGRKFAGTVAGLVHRSPPFHYHPDGEIKTRLCLKVDVS